MKNNISQVFLVGPMGAGKTTTGRQLAKILNFDFIDSDHEIESRTGVDIPLIFEKEGEEGFRKREQQVIDELTQLSNIVLATGGGAILLPENRTCLGSRGIVVYLYTSVDQQLKRVKKDKNRPLIQKVNPQKKLTELMEVRDPLYREIADIVVNTDARHVKSVLDEIVSKLKDSV